MSKLNVRPFEPGDLPKVLGLFSEAFGGRTLPARDYECFFLDGNPFGPPMIELAWDGDRLVSHYALSATESSVDGERVPSARAMTTMTHPDYAGRGLFSELALRLELRVRGELGRPLVWAFPNPNSHYGFVHKLGWSDLFPLFFLDVPASTGPEPSRLRPIGFEDLVGRVSTFPSERGVVPCARTVTFLRWRYERKPRYAILAADDLAAFAVTSTFRAAPDAPPMLNAVDMLGERSEVAALVRRLPAYARETGHATVAFWGDVRAPHMQEAERLRAKPRGIITYAVANAAAGSEMLDPRRWRVSMGDSDVF